MSASTTVGGTVIIAGAELLHTGNVGVLREIALRTDTGVFNSWAAKGLFAWNHPAHLGTIGLQANDIALAQLSTFDDVILCGLSNDELSRDELTAAGVRWRDVAPFDLDRESLPIRSEPTARPPLFGAIAAACGPLYADPSTPTSPARAASDLSAALPSGGVVAGDACRSGFWLGRTFPTQELASVMLPIRPTPGFAALQAVTARRSGRFSVAVVDQLDAATESVLARATDLVIEVWSEGGPNLTTEQRIARLLAAHETGGTHVVELGVRFSDISLLVSVAGAPRWHP
ncbi:MAG: hypothetical protein WCK14_13405 [Actinomycetota bacterium]